MVMSDDLPPELRAIAQEILDELALACGIDDAWSGWLPDYEVLELHAPRWVEAQDLEIYLPRPLVEDIANLDLAERKQILEELRGIPERARGGESRFWLLRQQGRAYPLPQRPFI
jgi:hypothetical protein